jgi:hypothetical protein
VEGVPHVCPGLLPVKEQLVSCPCGDEGRPGHPAGWCGQGRAPARDVGPLRQVLGTLVIFAGRLGLRASDEDLARVQDLADRLAPNGEGINALTLLLADVMRPIREPGGEPGLPTDPRTLWRIGERRKAALAVAKMGADERAAFVVWLAKGFPVEVPAFLDAIEWAKLELLRGELREELRKTQGAPEAGP